MFWFEELLRWTHVVFGFAGLAAYWVPIVSRKGGVTHTRFGRVFARCAYIVLASASLSVVYHLAKLLSLGISPVQQPNNYAFLIFLGYLALVTFVTVRHAILLLEFKRDPTALSTPLNIALARASQVASVLLVLLALLLRPAVMPVLLALSPVGWLTGRGILQYMSSPPKSSRGWMYEHLGNMIGAGIAFHTAFAVFGSSRLLGGGLDGALAVLPWVLPTAIGLPAMAIWIRHYKKKFGELETG